MGRMTDSFAQASGADRLLVFSIPSRHARGRVVRLESVLGEILSAHDYPPPIARMLSEALTVTALVGALLKDEGSQLTMQAEADRGPVRLLVCDWRDGELRGYAEFAPEELAMADEALRLEELFCDGRLVVTFEMPARRERYQGIVPLEGSSMCDALENYFARSEQVPTLLRVTVDLNGGQPVAGGLLLQHVAESEAGGERLHMRDGRPDWEHVAIMGSSISAEELTDRSLSLETISWRLFHEDGDIRVMPGASIRRGCRCSIAHFDEVLARFPKEDRREMADENGIIRVDCAFCSRQFAIQD
jgi:molecular chaperone Hsp33